MTGVLHPIGPEPERTYWVRRAVLLAVVIVLVGGLIAVAGTLGRGTQPAAGTAPVETPAVAPTESTPSSAAPSQTPAATAAPTPTPTPTPTATPTASASEASATARASASTSPGTSSTARPSADTSSTKATEKSGEKASEKAGSQKSAAPTSSASPSASAPALCAGGELTAKVSGDRTLKVDQNTTFTVSLTNGGATTCTLAVAPSTFELKIYSGTDRIWTTKDCAKAVKPATATVRPEQAVAWQQTWNGRRSASGCTTGAELPRPGVYWATAQYAGAKPTQLRMIVS